MNGFKKLLAFGMLATTAGFAGGYLAVRTMGHTSPFEEAPFAPMAQTSDNPFQAYYANNKPLVAGIDFTIASEKSTPAVVYIKTTSNAPQRSFNDWFFGDIFGGGRQDLVINSGSGVIVSSDGYIVTNNHVVEKAVKIEVILTNKQAYTATLVGTDPSTDLALLKVDASALPTIQFSNSNQLKVGEWVLAVGNPFNLTSTVTAGIVSAKGRNLNLLSNLFPIESFIQTDAAINPGNSGGALVDVNGQLVGINTAIYSRTGAYNGYGFAIPANIVQKVIRDLKEHGSVQRAFFGADVLDIDAPLREKAKLNSFKGVYVNNIAGYGPARDAGLKEGDVIIQFNQAEVNTKAEFDEQLSYFRPGDKINIVIQRNGQPKNVQLKLTNTEGTFEIVKNESVASSKLGADFEPIGKLERERLQLSGGVRIANIQANGYMRRLGLRDGFIITHINKVAVSNPEACIDLLENMRGQVTIEGVDQTGRKAYFSFYTY